MTEIRQLEATEYPVLKGIADGCCPDPSQSLAFVGREGEEITCRIFVMAPAHIEGPWIREDKRGQFLAKRLMDCAERAAKANGLNKIFAYGNEETSGYLERLGYKKEPMTVWVKEI